MRMQSRRINVWRCKFLFAAIAADYVAADLDDDADVILENTVKCQDDCIVLAKFVNLAECYAAALEC